VQQSYFCIYSKGIEIGTWERWLNSMLIAVSQQAILTSKLNVHIWMNGETKYCSTFSIHGAVAHTKFQHLGGWGRRISS
jgi:hypothetical protein